MSCHILLLWIFVFLMLLSQYFHVLSHRCAWMIWERLIDLWDISCDTLISVLPSQIPYEKIKLTIINVLCRQYSNLQRQFVEAFRYAFLKYLLTLQLFFFIFSISLLRKLALNLQFGSQGSLEQHGFARNRFWSIDTDPPPFPTNSKSFIDLILKPSEEDMQKWPNRWSHLNFYPLDLYLAI